MEDPAVTGTFTTLLKMYELEVFRQKQSLYKRLIWREKNSTSSVALQALESYIFDDGEPDLEHLLIQIADQRHDDDQEAGACPFRISDEARKRIATMMEGWDKSVSLIEEVIEDLEIHRGWEEPVPFDEFAEMSAKLSEPRRRFLKSDARDDGTDLAAWETAWPFQQLAIRRSMIEMDKAHRQFNQYH